MVGKGTVAHGVGWGLGWGTEKMRGQRSDEEVWNVAEIKETRKPGGRRMLVGATYT